MPDPPNETQASGSGSRSGLRDILDRMVAGAPNSDPLYLSNRTAFQKARPWIVVAAIVLAGAGVLAWFLTRPAPKTGPVAEISRAEMASKLAPALKNVQIPPNRMLELVDARVTREGAMKLVGSVKNVSGRLLGSAEIVFDLTDLFGSQVGSVTAKFENVAAGATADFSVPLTQETAARAMVRETHAQ
jgi:hypothetical protein